MYVCTFMYAMNRGGGKDQQIQAKPLLICLVFCTPYACIFLASTAPSTICTQQGREPRPPVPNVARWEPDVQQQAQRAQEPNQNNTEYGAPIHHLSKMGFLRQCPIWSGYLNCGVEDIKSTSMDQLREGPKERKRRETFAE